VYPALARVPADLFGICIVATSGDVYAAGDAEREFTIMSVAKPFIFALVCQALGPDEVRAKVGVNATGRPFNSLEGVEESTDGRTNPMVNSGAIATASLVPGRTADENGDSSRTASPASRAGSSSSTTRSTNPRQRQTSETAISQVSSRRAAGFMGRVEAVDLYTRQSSLSVSARDLAVMGATLADGGVKPVSGERVIDAEACRFTLAVMATAGLYETSGDWLYDVGLPGKSGIGGGIVTVALGKGGLGTFAPLLDHAGNSVKGQLTARFMAQSAGLDLFASKPEQ
jgi:glutaminase